MKIIFAKEILTIIVLLYAYPYTYSSVLSRKTNSKSELSCISIDSNNNLLKTQDSVWVNIFNGKNLEGWSLYNSDEKPQWLVQDTILFSPGGNGNIVTDSIFENFELEIEWKINLGGNSGIFYYVQEKKQYKKISDTGPEFQIIDDVNYPIKILEKQKTGACSDVLSPEKLVSHPPGQWNYTKIIVNKGNIEHWLNGELVLSYSMDSKLWKTAVQESKFSDSDYAKVRKGKIGLQDHGDPIYFRKIRIRKL